MTPLVSTMIFLSVLFPQKGWYAPDQAWNVTVKPPQACTIVLTDFVGKAIDSKGSVDVTGERTFDLKQTFPEISTPGTYILYAVPKNKPNREFIGTPLVVGVREDKRQGAPPGVMVVKIEPLLYAIMTTDKGPMVLAFYYDVAPHTVASFLSLSENGFYDGLTFHRIVKDFVIQGGDPRGDGTGGPGYMVDAEFNDRKHVPGVLSMARSGDPNEAGGAMPRCEFANSAGSQFFVCLNYENTKQLDGRYTAFGKVIEGMDAVNKIAASPIADTETGKPQTPTKIVKVEVKPVTSDHNPYIKMIDELNPSLIGK